MFLFSRDRLLPPRLGRGEWGGRSFLRKLLRYYQLRAHRTSFLIARTNPPHGVVVTRPLLHTNGGKTANQRLCTAKKRKKWISFLFRCLLMRRYMRHTQRRSTTYYYCQSRESRSLRFEDLAPSLFRGRNFPNVTRGRRTAVTRPQLYRKIGQRVTTRRCPSVHARDPLPETSRSEFPEKNTSNATELKPTSLQGRRWCEKSLG